MATKKKTPKKSSLEDRFQDLLDMDTPTIITLYGRPGTGKTTISCTLPKPLLLIDVKDKGTDSGKREDLEPGDITVFELESFDEIYDIYDYLEENPDKFKSVVIDHMTALQDFCYEKVMDEEGKSKMSQGMYGTAGGYLKEVINLYKGLTDLGITPCFNCQDRMESGDGEGEYQLLPEVGPSLMPSVALHPLCCLSCDWPHLPVRECGEARGGQGPEKHRVPPETGAEPLLHHEGHPSLRYSLPPILGGCQLQGHHEGGQGQVGGLHRNQEKRYQCQEETGQ